MARSGFLSTWDNWGNQVQPFAARAPLMVLNGNHERDFPGSNDSFANPVFGPGTLTCQAIANTSSPYCITDSRGECGAHPIEALHEPVLLVCCPKCMFKSHGPGAKHVGPARRGKQMRVHAGLPLDSVCHGMLHKQYG